MVGYNLTEREHPILYSKRSISLAQGNVMGASIQYAQHYANLFGREAVQNMAYCAYEQTKMSWRTNQLAPSLLTTVKYSVQMESFTLIPTQQPSFQTASSELPE